MSIRQRDALCANAFAATVPQDKPAQRMGSAENIPPMPTNPQDLEGWLSDRNCELRNAMEFGDVGLVALIGGLVGQGHPNGGWVVTAMCPWTENPGLL